MNTTIKRTLLAVMASCMLSAVMPTVCVEQVEQKGWSRWAKIGAATAVVAAVCAWLYLDARTQNILTSATTDAQKQFIEDLKYHATHNVDGSERIITPDTSYNKVPDAEFMANTVKSLAPLNTDFSNTLFWHQISSKACAVAVALGLHGLMQPTQEETEEEQTIANRETFEFYKDQLPTSLKMFVTDFETWSKEDKAKVTIIDLNFMISGLSDEKHAAYDGNIGYWIDCRTQTQHQRTYFIFCLKYLQAQ